MRIQLVNMAGYRPVFRNNGSCDDSKPATVGDLRDMEKRIIDHLDENFKNQNKMIGDALSCFVEYVRIPRGDFYNDAHRAANNLASSIIN